MKKALVVLSGGQDSATCMAWAMTMFDAVEAISFNYGQRHSKELEAAAEICKVWGIPHHIHEVPSMMNGPISGLTNKDLTVTKKDEDTGLPESFVPGRNLIFLNLAAAIGLGRGIYDIVTGVCQTDFSGYPDCRHGTIQAVCDSIFLGNRELIEKKGPGAFHIHTPLMYLTKAESIRLAMRLPSGLEAVGRSWTCYEGGEKPCGECPACKLRIKGFQEAGIPDPALQE